MKFQPQVTEWKTLYVRMKEDQKHKDQKPLIVRYIVWPEF